MSSLSKACFEISNSIKTFRFTRSSNDSTPPASTSTPPTSTTITTTTSSSLKNTSVSGTISRVLRSATCKMKGIAISSETVDSVKTKVHLPELWKSETFLDRLFSNFSDLDLLGLRLVHPLWKRLIDCRKGQYDETTAVLNYRQNETLGQRLAFLNSILLRGVHSLKVVAVTDDHCVRFDECVLPAETIRLVTSLSVHSSNINDISMETMISKFKSIHSLKLAGYKVFM